MIFEWDEDKNAINKQKHKISFETALHVFDDLDYIEIYEFVVFTERGENIRIISARLATEAERRLYYDKEISSY